MEKKGKKRRKREGQLGRKELLDEYGARAQHVMVRADIGRELVHVVEEKVRFRKVTPSARWMACAPSLNKKQ